MGNTDIVYILEFNVNNYVELVQKAGSILLNQIMELEKCGVLLAQYHTVPVFLFHTHVKHGLAL